MKVRILDEHLGLFYSGGTYEVLEENDTCYKLPATNFTSYPCWFDKNRFEVLPEPTPNCNCQGEQRKMKVRAIENHEELVKGEFYEVERVIPDPRGKPSMDLFYVQTPTGRHGFFRSRFEPFLEFADPSAQRDSTRIPIPVAGMTPYNHFPDLEGWTVQTFDGDETRSETL